MTRIADFAPAVEAALVAHGAVRRGRHLRFACVAHNDRHPSADYDPARMAWVCRACHVGGGVKDLAQRLGLADGAGTDQVRPRRRIRTPRPPAGIDRAAWVDAWPAIVAKARRQARRLAPHREMGQAADWLRARHQLVRDARRVISALGPDDAGAWRLAALAARVATHAAAVEADLDALLRDCHVT